MTKYKGVINPGTDLDYYGAHFETRIIPPNQESWVSTAAKPGLQISIPCLM
jgi:hypothetical protein